MDFTLKLLLILILGLWSCSDEQKTTTNKAEVKKKEIKKDSCEGVLASIEKKAYLKDTNIFKLDSVSRYSKEYEYLFSNKRSLSLTEFKCLGLKGKIWKDIHYENNGKKKLSNKRVYEDSDSIRYIENGLWVYNFYKHNDIQYFTLISPAYDGATRMFLLTVSDKNKKVVDIIEVAYTFGDIGAIVSEKSKILNDTIIEKMNVYSLRDTFYLKESSKFLITNSGEIKLLEHKVLINKELP